MKKALVAMYIILIGFETQALVSGSAVLEEGENRIGIETQVEGGTIEPNANRASYQSANINITRLKYSFGLADFLGLLSPNLNLEYGQFSSNEERVGATLFYPADSGNYVSLGLSAELLHDADRLFAFYINVTPTSSYNENKFSNPRFDKFSFGLDSSFNITKAVFQKSLIHYGSGDGKDQNSYIAVDTGFGFHLNSLVNFPLVLSSSLFLEADLQDRFDPAYDAAFSPAGTTDRVRAFKYGTLLGLAADVTEDISVSFNYLQKLGGYDARSTQISKLGIAYKF